jgi:hypothetical protein
MMRLRYIASQFVEKRTVAVCDIFTNYIGMTNLSFGAVGVGAASFYGSVSIKKMRLRLLNTSELGNF